MADDDTEPFEASLRLPYNYVIAARLRPSTVKQATLALLPWALWYVLPPGKLRWTVFLLADRVSPLMRPNIK